MVKLEAIIDAYEATLQAKIEEMEEEEMKKEEEIKKMKQLQQ